MKDDYIKKQDIIDFCQGNIALANEQIDEWLEHTLEYKTQHTQELYISRARQRKQDMEDVIQFVEFLGRDDDWFAKAFTRVNTLSPEAIDKLLRDAAEMSGLKVTTENTGFDLKELTRFDNGGPVCQYTSFILESERMKNGENYVKESTENPD